MAQFYYILNVSQYNVHSDNLEYSPVWNVSGSECIIEVHHSYVISDYLVKFEKSNDVQDWIYSSNRIDEWYQPDISEIP